METKQLWFPLDCGVPLRGSEKTGAIYQKAWAQNSA